MLINKPEFEDISQFEHDFYNVKFLKKFSDYLLKIQHNILLLELFLSDTTQNNWSNNFIVQSMGCTTLHGVGP